MITSRDTDLETDHVRQALSALPPLREVVAEHGLRAKKAFGQHFLLDLNITDKIARYAGDLSNSLVLEVGPGPGGLTRSLLYAGAHRVIALEKDTRCVEALTSLAESAQGRLEIIEADATGYDIAALGDRIKIISNLPYNVGTPLLIGWIKAAEHIADMTLMFQKEVAERICAPHGSKSYGRLSVLAQWRCETDYAFTLPARAFTPPPNVDSAIVRLIPKQLSDDSTRVETLEALTAAAFGQRRKTLRKSLSGLLGDQTVSLLETAELDPGARAETLTVADFARLAYVYEKAEAFDAR